jgi:phosphate transport system substrate-binding protein
MVLLILSTALGMGVSYQSNALLDQSDDIIVGAGAHFSWILFDRLKPELESIAGKKIELFGKNSMRGVGCNAGIDNALKSSPDNLRFGFVCCMLADEELKKKQLKIYPLVKEPILTLVNNSNPVTNLTKHQIQSIFEGSIKNWKEVGGPDKPIIVVARLHCKDRPGHWKRILPSHEQFTDWRIDVRSASEMVKKVTELPGAIGHIGAAWDFKKSDNVKAVTVDGYKPTAENLLSDHYPFYRILSAVTASDPTNELSKILIYAQKSDSLRKIAKEYELVPLN